MGIDQEQERAHGRLVDEVSAWAEEQYPGEIAVSVQEFLGERPHLSGEETNFAASWFLHDRDLPGGGTPLERYAIDGPDPAVRSLAQVMAQAKLRLWRVVSVVPGVSIDIEPYVGGDLVRVRSGTSRRRFGRGTWCWGGCGQM